MLKPVVQIEASTEGNVETDCDTASSARHHPWER
jgi:hypothetical protein